MSRVPSTTCWNATPRRGRIQVDLTTGAVSAADAGVAGPDCAAAVDLVRCSEKIPGTAATQYESADGRHVMASELLAMRERGPSIVGPFSSGVPTIALANFKRI